MTEFISATTAAKRLQVSRQRIYKLIKLGKLHKIDIDGKVFLDGAEVQRRKDELFVKSVNSQMDKEGC